MTEKTKNLYKCPNCKQSRNCNFVFENNGYSIYFCSNCSLGFTYPIPKDLGNYYSQNYWETPGILGAIKDFTFRLFQRRRVAWLKKYLKQGDVLDVGSGEGLFGKSLPNKYKVVNLDAPGSNIKNKSVIKKDFLKWNTKNKFDAICFWQSLEHLAPTNEYVRKAESVLNSKGLLLLEFPNINSYEARLFGPNWFHIDAPRHLSHLTLEGVTNQLRQRGFKIILAKSTPAYEYTVWGVFASILAKYGRSPTDSIKGLDNPLILLLASPVLAISFIAQTILSLIDKSAMAIVIARKP